MFSFFVSFIVLYCFWGGGLILFLSIMAIIICFYLNIFVFYMFYCFFLYATYSNILFLLPIKKLLDLIRV